MSPLSRRFLQREEQIFPLASRRPIHPAEQNTLFLSVQCSATRTSHIILLRSAQLLLSLFSVRLTLFSLRTTPSPRILRPSLVPHAYSHSQFHRRARLTTYLRIQRYSASYLYLSPTLGWAWSHNSPLLTKSHSRAKYRRHQVTGVFQALEERARIKTAIPTYQRKRSPHNTAQHR